MSRLISPTRVMEHILCTLLPGGASDLCPLPSPVPCFSGFLGEAQASSSEAPLCKHWLRENSYQIRMWLLSHDSEPWKVRPILQSSSHLKSLEMVCNIAGPEYAHLTDEQINAQTSSPDTGHLTSWKVQASHCEMGLGTPALPTSQGCKKMKCLFVYCLDLLHTCPKRTVQCRKPEHRSSVTLVHC